MSFIVTAKYSDGAKVLGSGKTATLEKSTPVSEVIKELELGAETTIDKVDYTVDKDNLYSNIECTDKISGNIEETITVYIKVTKKANAPPTDGIFKIKDVDGDPSSCIITGYKVEKDELPAELVIPDTIDGKKVAEIGEKAFYQCTKITTLDLSNCTQLTSIGESAFWWCGGIEELKLPVSLKSIDEKAFGECKKIKTLDLSKCTKLTSIGKEAFKSCTRINVLDLSKCIKLDSIGDSAFYGCEGINTLDLPNSLTSIDKHAFCECKNIKVLDLSKCINLDSIGESAFLRCSGIEKLKLPVSLKSIDESAFRCCKKIETLDLSNFNKLNSIGKMAFWNCGEIAELKLPASLMQIGEEAFEDCTIKKVTFENTENWKACKFKNCKSIDLSSPKNQADALTKYSDYEWKREVTP
ncbi:MAG: leucine-rich repeat domain-containing protein [Treponemataceae bacterium]